MIVLRSSTGALVVKCKPKEFAPELSSQHNKIQIIDELREWGVTMAAIAVALDVAPERLRSWRHRHYKMPEVYWRALLALHSKAREAIEAKTREDANE